MSRRAIKGINWAALSEKVAAEEKDKFLAFKAKSDQYLRRMTANPETPAKIDWAFYTRNIPIPGLVQKFQKEYESLVIPYPADKYTALIDKEEKETEIEVKEHIKNCSKEIEVQTAEIEKIKNLMPFDQMTMEDFRDLYPEYALDPINRPTAWPHTEEYQPDPERDRMP